MDVVMLSRKSPCKPQGGRPKRLGTLVLDHKTSLKGLFLGYDQKGREVAIPFSNLTKVLERGHTGYKVSVNIQETKESASLYFFKRFFKALIPETLKEDIRDDNFDISCKYGIIK